jgi:hypothetical protein
LGRLRSYLLLTLVFGALAGWAAAIDSGRLFDTWGFLKDTTTDTGNVITADTLGAPTLNTASAGGSASQIVLMWTASNDAYATHYQVLRCNPGSCTPTVQISGSPFAEGSLAGTCSTPSGTCTYTDTGLTGSTNYCYRIVTAYFIGASLIWTSGASNTICETTGTAFTNRTLRLHNSTAMDTSSLASSSITVNSKGGTHTWGYTPAANSTMAATGWTLQLALDGPTQAQTGNDTNVLVQIRTTNCSGALVSTLVNVNILVPDVSATAGKLFTLTPPGSATLSTSQALCLTLTNNDNGGGGPHDVVIRTDFASTLTTTGIISGLVVPITP